MRRSVLVYAALLSGFILWAYIEWTKEETYDPDEVAVILDAKPDELEEIVYDSEKLDVTVTMIKDDLGEYAWAEVVPKPPAEGEEPPQPDPANPHAPPPPDYTPAAFKVGKQGQKMLEGMAPFLAKRLLEVTEETDLAELGLDPAEATLTITRKGREAKTYELGGNVFGGVNVYVRDPGDGKIFIVDAKLITPLRSAKRTLLDRTLFPGAQTDVERVTVSDGRRTMTYEQRNPNDPDARAWVQAGSDESDASAAAWLDKALSLSASRYVQDDDETGELAPAFSYTVVVDGKEVGIEVMRGFDEEGQEMFFARSDHTRGTVRLHRSLAAEAAADLDAALGAQDAAEG